MKFYEIGVTGTKRGGTQRQLQTAIEVIASRHSEYGAVRVHEGDCVGVDAELTRMLLQWRLTWKAERTLHICGHPPTNSSRRAFVTVDEELPPDEYLARDRTIVRHGKDLILVLPNNFKFQQRGSGTWYTAAFALGLERDTRCILPTGSIVDATTLVPTRRCGCGLPLGHPGYFSQCRLNQGKT